MSTLVAIGGVGAAVVSTVGASFAVTGWVLRRIQRKASGMAGSEELRDELSR